MGVGDKRRNKGGPAKMKPAERNYSQCGGAVRFRPSEVRRAARTTDGYSTYTPSGWVNARHFFGPRQSEVRCRYCGAAGRWEDDGGRAEDLCDRDTCLPPAEGFMRQALTDLRHRAKPVGCAAPQPPKVWRGRLGGRLVDSHTEPMPLGLRVGDEILISGILEIAGWDIEEDDNATTLTLRPPSDTP